MLLASTQNSLSFYGHWQGVDSDGNALNLEILPNEIKVDCPVDCDGRFKRRQRDGYTVASYFLSHGAPGAFVPFENEQDDLMVFRFSDLNKISIIKGGYPEVIANITNTDSAEEIEFHNYQNQLRGKWNSEIKDKASIVLLVEENNLSIEYTDPEGNVQTQKDYIQAVYTSMMPEFKDVYLLNISGRNIITFKLDNDQLTMHEGGESRALFTFNRVLE